MPRLVVNLVTKTGSIDDGQRDAGTFLIQLELWSPRGQLSRTDFAPEGLELTHGDGLDANTLFDVGVGRVVGILALQYLLAAKSVHEGCAT